MRLGRNHAVLLAAAIVIGALLAPAISQAASLKLLSRGKITVSKHFRLTLTANHDLNAGKLTAGNTVNVSLSRGGETASYTFYGVTFNGRQNLSAAHVKGSFAKHRGRIRMSFKPAGKTYKVKVPKGCTGRAGSARNGTLTGDLRLGADRLGTIRLKRIRAALEKEPATTDCSGAGDVRHGIFLSASKVTVTEGFAFYALKPRKGRVTESVATGPSGIGYNFNYYLTSRVSRSLYKPSPDLRTATLQGGGNFGGVVNYTSKKTQSGTSGTLGGKSFVAHFAVIGNLRPFRKGRLPCSQSRS